MSLEMGEKATIPCSLPDDAFQQRLSMIRHDLLPHVIRKEALSNGVAWEFEQNDVMQERLERFVAFERECCSGLTFDLQSLSDPARLRLTVGGAGAERLARLVRNG